jgi:hypothetical protein
VRGDLTDRQSDQRKSICAFQSTPRTPKQQKHRRCQAGCGTHALFHGVCREGLKRAASGEKVQTVVEKALQSSATAKTTCDTHHERYRERLAWARHMPGSDLTCRPRSCIAAESHRHSVTGLLLVVIMLCASQMACGICFYILLQIGNVLAPTPGVRHILSKLNHS